MLILTVFTVINIVYMQTHSSTLVQEFYLHHNSWLYQWLCKKMGSSADAADISQDTYIKLLQKADLTSIKEPRAYLTTIAHALMVSHFRRQTVEKAYLEALTNMGISHAFSPEEHALCLETLIEFDTMLSGLNTNIREAYLLLQLEQLDYAQIAQQLNVSTRTVTTYIAKATLHCALFKQQQALL